MSSPGHDDTVTDDSSARGHNGDGNATTQQVTMIVVLQVVMMPARQVLQLVMIPKQVWRKSVSSWLKGQLFCLF
jgi:hypothetical protein